MLLNPAQNLRTILNLASLKASREEWNCFSSLELFQKTKVEQLFHGFMTQSKIQRTHRSRRNSSDKSQEQLGLNLLPVYPLLGMTVHFTFFLQTENP